MEEEDKEQHSICQLQQCMSLIYLTTVKGLILSKSLFVTYMMPSIMPYDFCWKCQPGAVPVSCLCNMALLLFWLLFANNSSRYCVRCASVIMLLPKLLSVVIVFGALLY